VYASDHDAASDASFVAGQLEHLVTGNRGRLLDARRTPVAITAVLTDTGAFEVEIGAFEDAGTRWQLPLTDVDRFQFERDAGVTSAAALAQLRSAANRFDRRCVIDCDPANRARTLRLIVAERHTARAWVAARGAATTLELDRHVASREGDPGLCRLVEEYMAGRELGELERSFADAFATNPRSCEFVKGHAIVLAELGLCPYRGQIVRDRRVFDPPASRAQRAAHVITRLALMAELWSHWGIEAVTLYRGAAVDGPLRARAPASLVSATFAADVAQAHFNGGPTTQTAALWRQRLSVTRILMTFLETAALNRRFHEAEAVLIADPDNLAF
jgi:hypothetical protein